MSRASLPEIRSSISLTHFGASPPKMVHTGGKSSKRQLPSVEDLLDDMSPIYGGNGVYQRLALGFAMLTYFVLAMHLVIDSVIGEGISHS